MLLSVFIVNHARHTLFTPSTETMGGRGQQYVLKGEIIEDDAYE